MQTNNLQELQRKLEKLLSIHAELRQENQALRDAESQWQAERTKLIQQNDLAHRKVNEMIERLQILERNSG